MIRIFVFNRIMIGINSKVSLLNMIDHGDAYSLTSRNKPRGNTLAVRLIPIRFGNDHIGV